MLTLTLSQPFFLGLVLKPAVCVCVFSRETATEKTKEKLQFVKIENTKKESFSAEL